MLLISSLFFYAWGEGQYVLLMIVSIALNFSFAILIDKTRSGPSVKAIEKAPLFVVRIAVIVNLAILIFYKYANFLVANFNAALQWAHVQPVFSLAPIHLPIGISFITFHAISYVIDVYRRQSPCQKNPFLVALYISLFPQLVAGPIIRYHDIADQLTQRFVGLQRFADGIRRFVVGLGKKVLIANTLGAVADQIFLIQSSQLTMGLSWLGITCYALQIYFDFSGYSDMAIGLGKMFGFEFLENFNYPYVARSVTDFWRRWHISLTRWFRDYVYVTLGGNRCGALRTYSNLLTVFFLCGLWHGASWNFVVWGLFHGTFLVLERLKFWRWTESLGGLVARIYTILVVLVGWVFFRAENLSSAVKYLEAMIGLGRGDGKEFFPSIYLTHDVVLALVVGAIASTPVIRFFRPVQAIRLIGPTAETILLSAIFLASSMQLAAGTYNPFIYFRF